jgi:cell wall-associated NlpC family hydrolase
MKNLLIILGMAMLTSSCNTTRSGASTAPAAPPPEKKSSIEFIDNISFQPQTSRNKTSPEEKSSNLWENTATRKSTHHSSTIETYSPLQFKYAILTGATVEEMTNIKLLNFMEYWYGAPYHYGGSTRDGIDCSAFASLLMSAVYGIDNLPRMSKDQYFAGRRIGRDELQEGDLIFFHTMGKHRSVTHVGVYLRNQKFVHASISGVMISDMGEGYYSKHFSGAARVRETM